MKENKYDYGREIIFNLRSCHAIDSKVYLHWLEKIDNEQQLNLHAVVSCVCKIPEPRLKVSENGTYAYCNNCAKTYWQK